ncbi:MAG: hypothetical protein U9P11_02420 [Pseudomonadota bacterium]|nr:hypothetical protein [Pseudomonadota bacterium]
MKQLKILSAVVLSGALVAMGSASYANERENGRGTGPIVFVKSQELYYDSIVVVDPLPMKGRFQQLFMGEPHGLSTDYGPGEVGHLGGRWWIDVNGDTVMDEDDKFFLCPLLGPGREEM